MCLLSGCGNSLEDPEMVRGLDELEFRISVLEDRCNRINTNVQALKSIVLKSPEKDRITAVIPVMDNNVVSGYRIEFAYGESITVYCARDGRDGEDARDGKDGKDGVVPVIGLRDEGGVSYWTVNGDFILDDAGNRIPLVLKTGSSNDGRTPRLKVENGAWYYSMDEGTTWTGIDVDVKYGDGNIFSSVTQNNEAVVFTLADGTQISIPKKSAISLSLSSYSESVSALQTVQVSYQLEGVDAGTVVDAFAQGEWKVEVTPSSENAGTVRITAPLGAASSSVVVFATSGSGLSVYKTIKLTVL